jgi:hypothetical protein
VWRVWVGRVARLGWVCGAFGLGVWRVSVGVRRVGLGVRRDGRVA